MSVRILKDVYIKSLKTVFQKTVGTFLDQNHSTKNHTFSNIILSEGCVNWNDSFKYWVSCFIPEPFLQTDGKV